MIAELGVEAQRNKTLAGNSQQVVDNLVTRQESIAGVSLAEESVNLIRFQQAYNRQRGGHRQDDLQGIQRQRDIRQQEDRQGIRQLSHVANGADVQPQRHGDRCQHHNRHQGRGHCARDVGKQVDNSEATGGHGVHMPGHPRKFRQLGDKDQNGEGVDEAGNHRARHETHQ